MNSTRGWSIQNGWPGPSGRVVRSTTRSRTESAVYSGSATIQQWLLVPSAPGPMGRATHRKREAAMRTRRRLKGIMLLEVLCYIAVILILFGVIMQSTSLVARSLAQSAKREQRLQEWAQLAQIIRDDLRQSAQITWMPPRAPSGGAILALSRPDGTVVEYWPLEKELERRLVRDDKRTEAKSYRNYQLTRARYAKDGALNAWDLADLTPGEVLRISNTPRFILLTLELQSDGGLPADKAGRAIFSTQVVGAATRLEAVGGGAAKP